MTADLGIAWFRRDLRLDDNPAWAAATAEHGRVLALYVIDPALLDRAGSRRAARLLGDVAALDRAPGRGRRAAVRAHRRPGRRGGGRGRGPWRGRGPRQRRRHALRDPPRHRDRRCARPPPAWRGAPAGAPSCSRRARCAPRPAGSPRSSPRSTGSGPARPWEPWPEPGDARVLDDPGDPLPPAPGAVPAARRAGGSGGVCPVRPVRVERLAQAAERADRYDDERNRPDLVGTSELSADLRFGTLSPRTVAEVVGESSAGRTALVRQLAWRDWYAHLLLATPSLVERPMKDTYAALRWRDDPEAFEAWAHGPHRLPDGRRRHAPAAGHRVDAQPGADAHGLVPGEEPADRLADGGAPLPAPADRRRRPAERGQLAVGGRHRPGRVALQPGLQPDPAGPQVRSRRATTCGGGCPSWPASPGARSTSRGRSGRWSWPRRVWCSATRTRRRSSTWGRAGPVPSPRTRRRRPDRPGVGHDVGVATRRPRPRPGAPEAPRLPDALDPDVHLDPDAVGELRGRPGGGHRRRRPRRPRAHPLRGRGRAPHRTVGPSPPPHRRGAARLRAERGRPPGGPPAARPDRAVPGRGPRRGAAAGDRRGDLRHEAHQRRASA